MEFAGNRISLKTVLATLAVAFLAGRINLFDGTFPAGAALITVMAAVSTVYIYLVPFIILGMGTFAGQGAVIWGDVTAVIFCGVFFLFFHSQKFTINQRTAVAAGAVILADCIVYGAANMLYLLSLQTLLREALAVVVYIRVFNTLVRMVCGAGCGRISAEKAGISLAVFAVSMLGAAGGGFSFPLWVFAAVLVQYCRGIQPALMVTGTAAVYSSCQGGVGAELFVILAAGLITGWFLAGLLEGRYRKAVLALTVFAAAAAASEGEIYGVAAAMALMTALPSSLIVRAWCAAESLLMPEAATEKDVQLHAVRRDLMRKRNAFASLARLHGTGHDSPEIISCQFEGMVRTVDGILEDLAGRGQEGRQEAHSRQRTRGAASLAVGSASYAFENVSGDSCLSFSFGKNKQALIISDGMGKGSRAQSESRLVVETLSRLLQAGFDVDIAIKTVNAVLMAENSREMFATLDLAIIDRETGRAQIFKMGAASTFVKHSRGVSMLKRPAPPAGILDGVRLEYIDVKLHRGDLLVMVSDGVTDCDRKDPDCSWLRRRLTEIGSRDPETVAELIVNKAAEKYGLRERDDLTVMVASV
ncbi:MAG: SpoIIE family protein phosphatase [Emergencia sp.]